MTAILEPLVAPEVATQTPAVPPPTAAAPVPPAPPAPPAPPVPAPAVRVRAPRPRRTYPTALAFRIVGVLTMAAWIAAVAIEPTPNGPQPVPGAWDVLLAYATLAALGAAVWGLTWARHWGPAAGVLNGTLLVALAASCPATGHHVIAGWWWAQLGLSALMLAAPAWLLLARRAGRLR